MYSQHQVSYYNPLHYTAFADLAEPHNIYVFVEIFEAIPHGFSFLSTSRPVSDT
jgi:hypothetical protein